MVKKILILMLISTFLLLVAMQALAQRPIKSHSTMKGLNCSACHECMVPNKDNPCLKLSAQFLLGEGEKLTEQKLPPEFVIIKTLEDEYHPVKYPHRKHSHMSDNTLDCKECHHYTPAGQVKNPPCADCHNKYEYPVDMKQVGLNAAYHRRCLGCHVEWSNNTNCEVCHKSKNTEIAEKLAKTMPQFRKATRPEQKVFVTRMFTGPYVTFSHKAHTERKNVNCADCHQKWECVSCHYQGETAPATVQIVTGKGVHGACRLCHETMGKEACVKCHTSEEKQNMNAMNPQSRTF